MPQAFRNLRRQNHGISVSIRTRINEDGRGQDVPPSALIGVHRRPKMFFPRFLFCWFLVFCAAAQDTRTVSEPRIPPVCTTLSARVSAAALNESSLDTSTIQSALNGCPAGQAVE